jgi:hypothetical protein
MVENSPSAIAALEGDEKKVVHIWYYILVITNCESREAV